eukprot:6747510-Pyramimonas_sp.AAC.1
MSAVDPHEVVQAARHKERWRFTDVDVGFGHDDESTVPRTFADWSPAVCRLADDLDLGEDNGAPRCRPARVAINRGPDVIPPLDDALVAGPRWHRV